MFFSVSYFSQQYLHQSFSMLYFVKAILDCECSGLAGLPLNHKESVDV